MSGEEDSASAGSSDLDTPVVQKEEEPISPSATAASKRSEADTVSHAPTTDTGKQEGGTAADDDDDAATTPNVAFRRRRLAFQEYIQGNIHYLKKRNAMIALKYQDVKFYHDSIQISTILMSTVLTCMETVKAEMDWNTSENATIRRTFALMPVFLSSYIALIMSISKFKRLTEKLEEMSNISEKCNHVVCRMRRVQEDAHNTRNDKQLDLQKMTYSKETFDLYMTVRQSLDGCLRFQDQVKYKKKYELLLRKTQKTSAQICMEDELPWYCRWWRRCCCCCGNGSSLPGDDNGDPHAFAAAASPTTRTTTTIRRRRPSLV